jgi:hypothetical protein
MTGRALDEATMALALTALEQDLAGAGGGESPLFGAPGFRVRLMRCVRGPMDRGVVNAHTLSLESDEEHTLNTPSIPANTQTHTHTHPHLNTTGRSSTSSSSLRRETISPPAWPPPSPSWSVPRPRPRRPTRQTRPSPPSPSPSRKWGA